MFKGIANEMGFAEVKVINDRYYAIGLWAVTRYGKVLLVGNRFGYLTENLLEESPELRIGLKDLLHHEEAHFEFNKKDGFWSFLRQYISKNLGSKRARRISNADEAQANLYAASKSETPIDSITSSLFIFHHFYTNTYGDWLSAERFARINIELHYPWLNERAEDAIMKKLAEIQSSNQSVKRI